MTYPSLRDLYIASRPSTLRPDQYDRKAPVQSATGRCRTAHRGPCRSSGATVCHSPDPPEVARSPAAPSTRSESYTVVHENGRCSGVSPSQSYVCTSTTTLFIAVAAYRRPAGQRRDCSATAPRRPGHTGRGELWRGQATYHWRDRMVLPRDSHISAPAARPIRIHASSGTYG